MADLVIRTDANTRIGTGHLMRCLALGQAWIKKGGEVRFITSCSNEGLLRRLRNEGFGTFQLDACYPDPRDWQAVESLLAGKPKPWLVLDGYHFDVFYQNMARGAGCRVMVIDDMAHLPFYDAHVVVNQNIQSPDLLYSCTTETRLLRGTEYALLRREFLEWQGWRREFPEIARNILVSIGGGDPDNTTLKVIRALKKISVPDIHVSIVVGPTNLHQESIREELARVPFCYSLCLSTENMVELMASADVAVSAAGSTVWELAFMGLPGVLLVVAENQRGAAQRLKEEDIFLVAGPENRFSAEDLAAPLEYLMREKEIRQRMSQKARLLVDGLGANRVTEVLLKL